MELCGLGPVLGCLVTHHVHKEALVSGEDTRAWSVKSHLLVSTRGRATCHRTEHSAMVLLLKIFTIKIKIAI